MMTTLKHELEEKLNKLKGVLLLDIRGHVYLIKEWELDDNYTEATWFKPRKQYWNIKFSYQSVKDIANSEPWTNQQIIKFVNDRVEDRNRYLNLQKSLHGIGCRIITIKTTLKRDDKQINKTQSELPG